MKLSRQSAALLALVALATPVLAQGRSRGQDDRGRGDGKPQVIGDQRNERARIDDHRRDERALAEARAAATARSRHDDADRANRAREERTRGEERARAEARARAEENGRAQERARAEARARDNQGARRDDRERTDARARVNSRERTVIIDRDRGRQMERFRPYDRGRLPERWAGERVWRDNSSRILIQWFSQPRHYYNPRYAFSRLPYGWEDVIYEDMYFPAEYDAWTDEVPLELEYQLPPLYRGHRRFIFGDRLIVIDRFTRNIVLVVRL